MHAITKLTLGLGPILAASLYIQPYRPVIVNGRSMMPTFHSGQLVFVTPMDRAPRDGDVVLAKMDGSTVIKRVTMVAGDCYPEVKVLSDSDWTIASTPGEKSLMKKGRIPYRISTMPQGRVFLSGDNPMMSYDSRQFGPISRDAILGLIVARP